MANDEQFVLSRLAHYEQEESKAREKAALFLKQADECQSKAHAYRLVLEDMREAKRTEAPPAVVAPAIATAAKPAFTRVDNSPVSTARFLHLMPGGAAEASFQRAIRSAVDPLPDRFEPSSVRESVERIAPGTLDSVKDRNAVNKALGRMAANGEIFLVRKGRGKMPPIYSKTKPEKVEEVEGEEASDEQTTDAEGGGE